MQVLVVDVGGTHVKILATGQEIRRKFVSGSSLTAEETVAEVLKAAEGWKYEVVSIGYPARPEVCARDCGMSPCSVLVPAWSSQRETPLLPWLKFRA